jgi:hypothetical protein
MVERIGLTSEDGFPKREIDHVLHDMAVKREGISQTVDRLGDRIDEAFDWRIQVARHPYVAIAAAAGVGFLVSRLLKPKPTPAMRAMEIVGRTLREVAEGLKGSTNAVSADHGAPPTMNTFLGTAVARAGMEFLLRRINEALLPSLVPRHDTHAQRSNGSNVPGAHRAPDHEARISNTG